MRENRTSGSEGRESETNRTSLPLSATSIPDDALHVIPVVHTNDESSCRCATQPTSGRATLLVMSDISPQPIAREPARLPRPHSRSVAGQETRLVVSVECWLDDLPAHSTKVELYAGSTGPDVPVIIPLERVDELPGSVNGYVFSREI